MRAISCIVLLFVGCACADEIAERAGVEHVIAAWNDSEPGSSAQSSLFTADAETEPYSRKLPPGPWSEVGPPHMVVQKIRFVTADVALVDVVIRQYGSNLPWRPTPALLVMKKQVDWRIASFRFLATATLVKP